LKASNLACSQRIVMNRYCR